MAWPVPSAKTLAERLAGAAETAITLLRPTIDPLALSRSVRSSRGMLATIFRTVAMETREIHDHVAWWGRQYFPDTAEDEFVLRHASMWGVAQRPATGAIGTILVEGIPGTVLPSGIELADSVGVIVVTSGGAVIAGGGTVSVPVAVDATYEASGNIEAGARLQTAEPYPEITRITVEEPGLAGGAATATMQELAAAVVERIRQPPHGGASFDYRDWLDDAFAVAAVKVVTDWIGRGSVGVIVAMQDGLGGVRAATGPEVDAMQAYLGELGSQTGVKPVTANVVVVAATIEPIDIEVRLRPDTEPIRAAVEEAFQRFVATIGDSEDDQNAAPIGAIIEPSRISEAISASSGEYGHDLVAPAARYTLDPTVMPIAGDVTFIEVP